MNYFEIFFFLCIIRKPKHFSNHLINFRINSCAVIKQTELWRKTLISVKSQISDIWSLVCLMLGLFTGMKNIKSKYALPNCKIDKHILYMTRTFGECILNAFAHLS